MKQLFVLTLAITLVNCVPFNEECAERIGAAEPIISRAAEPVIVEAAEPAIVRAAEPAIVRAAEPVVVKAAEPRYVPHPSPIIVSVPPVVLRGPRSKIHKHHYYHGLRDCDRGYASVAPVQTTLVNIGGLAQPAGQAPPPEQPPQGQLPSQGQMPPQEQPPLDGFGAQPCLTTTGCMPPCEPSICANVNGPTMFPLSGDNCCLCQPCLSFPEIVAQTQAAILSNMACGVGCCI